MGIAATRNIREGCRNKRNPGSAWKRSRPSQAEDDQSQADHGLQPQAGPPANQDGSDEGGRDPEHGQAGAVLPAHERQALGGRSHQSEEVEAQHVQGFGRHSRGAAGRLSGCFQSGQKLNRSQSQRQQAAPAHRSQPPPQAYGDLAPRSDSRSEGTGLLECQGQGPYKDEQARVESELRVRSEDHQGQNRAGPGGEAEAPATHGPF